MTLVEVVVGLMLLATLLVAILAAFGRHVRQVRHGQIRLEAARAADALLAEWFAEGGNLPREDEGVMPDNARFLWRITPVEDNVDETFDMGTIRFEVFYRDQEAGGTRAEQDRQFFSRPLVSIELAVPSSGR